MVVDYSILKVYLINSFFEKMVYVISKFEVHFRMKRKLAENVGNINQVFGQGTVNKNTA